MTFIGWIFFGLITGFIASRIVKSEGSGVLVDIFLGALGAVVGGALFGFFGYQGVTGFNMWSFFVAVVGASLLLYGYHAVLGRRRS